MNICAMGIVLASFYELLLKFETVPTVWYVLFFILLQDKVRIC